jgi:hypothetical protein
VLLGLAAVAAVVLVIAQMELDQMVAVMVEILEHQVRLILAAVVVAVLLMEPQEVADQDL